MRQISETIPGSGTINFLMSDTTTLNGPIRQIPGSHANVQMPPQSADEPEWMRLSTLVGAPAGSGIFRDHRAWHGAVKPTSNLPLAVTRRKTSGVILSDP
jgi:ectoine hydroxylase-related dioxygenase (phytanoyl-CoA dioxygenase family)